MNEAKSSVKWKVHGGPAKKPFWYTTETKPQRAACGQLLLQLLLDLLKQ